MIARFLLKMAAATSIGTPRGTGYVLAQTGGGGVHVPTHERFVLENGITLVIVPRRDVPLVAFNAVLRGGGLGDRAGKPGVASLAAGLLEKGAGKRDAFAFADAVEGVGGSFNAGAGAESISIRGQFLARDQHLMLELLSDALLHPRFENEELETLRSRHIEMIKAAKDSDPSELIGLYGRAFLFRDHPYGRPVIGSETSLAAITQRDVLDYYAAQFGADRLTLVFAGDVDSVWLKRTVSKLFAGWRKAGAPAPKLVRPRKVCDRRVLLIDSPGSVQTYFWIGNVGVDRRYPQRAALDLVNTLYGGRFTSILNTELRIKSGLSYGARSGFARGTVPGEFAIHSFTQTESTALAIDLSLQTLTRLKREGVTAEMLDSARAYVLGQYPLSFETATDWAAALGEIELYGLGPDYIDNYAPTLRKVTLQDASTVIAEAFPTPDALAIVLVGDATKIRDRVKDYGPITEMTLTQPTFDPTDAVAIVGLAESSEATSPSH
jgi:predicted Zn-dependent peptidase